MNSKGLGACILAAGKGTRMHSQLPKVLLPLLHEPMLAFIYSELDQIFPKKIYTVIGHGADTVRQAFPDRDDQSFILQDQQLGTGHALQCAWGAFKNAGLTHVLVANGDTPLLCADKTSRFIEYCQQHQAQLGFMTLSPPDPGAMGRVLRKQGRVQAIIEAKDYDPQLHGPDTSEINAGIYYIDIAAIAPLLDQLENNNKSGEYYITDLVGLAVGKGLTVLGCDMGDDRFLLGINSPRELSQAEELLRKRLVEHWLDKHVSIRQPDSVRIGPNVSLAPGAFICGPCEIYGQTSIAAGCQVESHCVIIDSQIAQNCRIRNFSHLENAVLEPDSEAGPYARLRPGAVMKERSRVGNFVEMKKAVLEAGAKANHLTYLGDATVGAGSNIGAGTITCNYDGHNKHTTTIGAGAFIGSNTALVAPVTVGEGALVAAGSVITEDVPAEALAIGRARQTIKSRKKGS